MDKRKRKIKILFIGSDDILLRKKLLTKFNSKDFEVTILGSAPVSGDEFYPVTYMQYPLNRRINLIGDLKTIFFFRKFLKNNSYDIIHTFTTKPNILLPIACTFRSSHPKIVRTITGLGRIFFENTLINKIIKTVYDVVQRFLVNQISYNIFQNEDDADYYRNKKMVSEDTISIVHGSGIDLEYYSRSKVLKKDIDALKKELKLNPKAATLVYIGRLVKQKGIHHFLEAVKSITDKGTKLNVLIAGSFDEASEDSLHKKDLDQYKDYIQFLGIRKDIREILYLSDIIVLPSYGEGLPRVLLEAAAMEVGIITTDARGCREIIKHKKNGIIVPLKNLESMSDVISDFIKDKDFRKKMVSNNKKMVREYEIDKVYEMYKKIYQKVLGVK